MSMSMSVVGIVPDDEKWKKMATAYKACRSAGVDPPREVLDFFDGAPPDGAGKLVNVEHHQYEGASQEGLEVVLSELPKDVKRIRFFCSW